MLVVKASSTARKKAASSLSGSSSKLFAAARHYRPPVAAPPAGLQALPASPGHGLAPHNLLMAVSDSNSVAKEEAPGEDMVESPLQGSKMWFDNCTRVTTMSSIAGMAFGSMRVLSSAHAQGLAVNDVQYLIPQSAISYAVRVGIFTGVFCLSRNYGLTAGQELTAPNEIAASASAGALSGLLMSGAQLRSRNGVRRLLSGAATGALLGGFVGCATALARASQRMVDGTGEAEEAECGTVAEGEGAGEAE